MSRTSNQDNHIHTNHNQETDEPNSSPTTAISTATANTVAIGHHDSSYTTTADIIPRPRKQSGDSNNYNNHLNNSIRNRREAIALDGLMFDSGSLQDLAQVQEVMRQTRLIECQSKMHSSVPHSSTCHIETFSWYLLVYYHISASKCASRNLLTCDLPNKGEWRWEEWESWSCCFVWCYPASFSFYFARDDFDYDSACMSLHIILNPIQISVSLSWW